MWCSMAQAPTYKPKAKGTIGVKQALQALHVGQEVNNVFICVVATSSNATYACSITDHLECCSEQCC